MNALFKLLPGPQPALIRLGTTAVLVLMAFAVRYAIGDGTGRYGFIHFILPVVAASLLFDRTSGFFAIALSLGLLGSLLSWNANVGAHITAMAVFTIVGTVLVFLAAGLREAIATANAAQQATSLLLQEMSHRVKNKFTMITSIIGLQARSAPPEVKHALEDIAARVNVMMTVHNYLQLSRHGGLIDVSEYLPGLCRALTEALCGPRPITLTVLATRTYLPADKALATGLIVNELVTNAFKYAFPSDRAGSIRVELQRAGADMELSVADDGCGYAGEGRTGLGSRLVTVFAAQLGGTATWSRTPNVGCTASVVFPLSEVSQPVEGRAETNSPSFERFPTKEGAAS